VGSRGRANSLNGSDASRPNGCAPRSATSKGLEALRSYARTPVAFTPLKSDALLRLLICDLVGEEVTRASMATLRDDIAELEARLEEAEHSAHQLAHREKYLLLVTTFMRQFLDLHSELVDQVEHELQPQAAAETPA
jgi:hypothetical protein